MKSVFSDELTNKLTDEQNITVRKLEEGYFM